MDRRRELVEFVADCFNGERDSVLESYSEYDSIVFNGEDFEDYVLNYGDWKGYIKDYLISINAPGDFEKYELGQMVNNIWDDVIALIEEFTEDEIKRVLASKNPDDTIYEMSFGWNHNTRSYVYWFVPDIEKIEESYKLIKEHNNYSPQRQSRNDYHWVDYRLYENEKKETLIVGNAYVTSNLGSYSDRENFFVDSDYSWEDVISGNYQISDLVEVHD